MLTNYEKLQLVSAIAGGIDWSRVQTAMNALNWTWSESNNQVPSIYELSKKANDLGYKVLTKALEKPSTTYELSAGGIVATSTIQDGIPYVKIDFSVESYDNYDFEFKAVPE